MSGSHENGGRVNIKQLAAAAGVSPTTVTNALAGKQNVSSEKREEIVSLARELGYRPNTYAKAMTRNGIKIGIVYPRCPQVYSNALLSGVGDCLARLEDFKVKAELRSYNSLISKSGVEEALVSLSKAGVDGIIFAPNYRCGAYSALLSRIITEKSIPLVYLSHDCPGVPGNLCIRCDADAIGGSAARMFGLVLGKGSEVAAITSFFGYTAHAKMIEAFCRGCTADGLVLDAVYEDKGDPMQTYYLTRRLLEEYPLLRGIYVSSHDSVSVCSCLDEMGAQGVSVVAHDVYPEMEPYLRSGHLIAAIFRNTYQAGLTACERLVNLICGQTGQDSEIVLRPEIVLSSNFDSYKNGGK